MQEFLTADEFSPLDNIRIVMVNTSHSGNIGAAARVMKNMGLSQLYLVEPKAFPHPDALSMAVGAKNLLEQAIVVDKLEQALEGCHLVFGTTARSRKLRHQIVDPNEAAIRCAKISTQVKVAFVFGRERTGLSNEEIEQCEVLINIPTDPNFSSLNIASAVQIISYELIRAHQALEQQNNDGIHQTLHKKPTMASHNEIENFFNHLQSSIESIGFLDRKCSPQIMPKLKNIYHRCQLEKSEVNMLRGILTAIDKKIN